jgi:hypothetical protein
MCVGGWKLCVLCACVGGWWWWGRGFRCTPHIERSDMAVSGQAHALLPPPQLRALPVPPQIIRTGGIFAKYEMDTPPQKRFVWLSDDLKYLHWKQLGVVKAYSTVCVRDIFGVVQGCRTPVLRARGKDGECRTQPPFIPKVVPMPFGWLFPPLYHHSLRVFVPCRPAQSWTTPTSPLFSSNAASTLVCTLWRRVTSGC